MSLPTHDWNVLTRLAEGQGFTVERVRLHGAGVAIEGAFALPPLAQLSHDDQVFVAAFLRAHGSIKEMEKVFGVSYPTIKARLNRLAGVLDPIEHDPAPARGDVLDRLAAGEIDAAEAIRLIEERP
ncbi:MAG TPA: DUF2089 domain-containing protein [Caulobacteraceae bacterium]|jgi:hypothetical protein